MNFMDAVKICFNKYVDFTGRARRSEFWWFFLFQFLVNLVLGWIPIVGLIAMLGLVLPGLAVAVRRLHDTDRSGWWVLAPYVPWILFLLIGGVTIANGGQPGVLAWLFGLIGVAMSILILVWLASRGTVGDNRFGPDPLAGEGYVPPADPA
ncbi:DUF805 domain-containing protein [Rhodobacterales bacterium HKCCE2091]|nr:DUF805 domain-containing protein [Rhodobacterales bacterium HKCCE2091]